MLTFAQITEMKLDKIEKLLKPSHKVQINKEIREELEVHLNMLSYLASRERHIEELED